MSPYHCPSYYLAYTGWRYAKNRSGLPSKVDFIISLMMLMSSIIMIGYGLFHTSTYESIVLLVFGAVGGMQSFSNLKTFKNKRAFGAQRIANHLGGMLGATIAALTAFFVTNIHIESKLILWLGPTVVLTPVIVWWKYKVRP